MQVPVFAIREKDYVNSKPAEGTAFSSLVKTFRNNNFRIFVGSDIFYWIALTMFQTGLPFFVTSLLKLPESMSTVFFVAMTALSLVFYPLVNILTRKVGKRNLVLTAFLLFAICFGYTAFMGESLAIPAVVQGFILVIVAAFPMAIFGILPQAMVADISESDARKTGENREGMFYAARTFAFKLGQSVSMLLFTALATIGSGGTGYRVVAGVSSALALLGGVILLFYNEKKLNESIR
jgi:Na+/melibiose symporter-like transporter